MNGKANLAASVAARLLNLARQTGDNYQGLLTSYCLERFLYRLAASDRRDRFVLKGAMLLKLWSERPYRATLDLDLLRRGEGSEDAIRADLRAIVATPVPPDAVEFDGERIRIEAIRAEDEYAGTRATLPARCGQARVSLQIDMGLADAVWPAPQPCTFPTLLDLPAPELLAHPREAVVAEKLEAMVVLGDRKSRIKDFSDVHHLASRFEFDRPTLAEAVRRTFARRRTPIPEVAPIALTREYWENPSRPAQVRAFARAHGSRFRRTSPTSAPACSTPFSRPCSTICAPGQASAGIGRRVARGGEQEGGWKMKAEATRRFKPYPAYKDSGVEWLGEIPAHWEVARISELTSLLNGYPFDSEFFTRGEGIPLVRIRDLNAEETEVNYAGPIIESAWIEPGDVIIGMDGDFNVSDNALLLWDLLQIAQLGWLRYVLDTMNLGTLAAKNAQPIITGTFLSSQALAVPPEPEQRAIAAFLDRETARIDALVGKVREAIERLKELRTALISAAVTGKIDVREGAAA